MVIYLQIAAYMEHSFPQKLRVVLMLMINNLKLYYSNLVSHLKLYYSNLVSHSNCRAKDKKR